ncbi:hypothetical protein ACTXT7_002745 [Hymenolepis weldensis]
MLLLDFDLHSTPGVKRMIGGSFRQATTQSQSRPLKKGCEFPSLTLRRSWKLIWKHATSPTKIDAQLQIFAFSSINSWFAALLLSLIYRLSEAKD